MNRFGPRATAHNDDLSEQLEALRADVARLIASVSDEVSDGLEKAGRQVRRKGRDAQASATNAVLEHPLAALGIAVGIGLALGLFTRKG